MPGSAAADANRPPTAELTEELVGARLDALPICRARCSCCIQPSNALLRRLRETPIVSHAPLPGPRVPVTPSQNNLDVLRIIELAR